MEKWKPIQEYENNYKISSKARVKSLERERTFKQEYNGKKVERTLNVGGKVLKPQKTKAGYHLVRLHKNGNYEARYVHRLVLEHFEGSPPTSNHQAHHLNGDKTDNDIENLKWVTKGENVREYFQTDEAIEKTTSLSEKEISWIKWLSLTKIRNEGIGNYFDIATSTVKRISPRGKRRKERWIQVEPKKPPHQIRFEVAKESKKLSNSQVLSLSELKKLKELLKRDDLLIKEACEIMEVPPYFPRTMNKTFRTLFKMNGISTEKERTTPTNHYSYQKI